MNRELINKANETMEKSGAYVALKYFAPNTIFPINDITASEGKYGLQYMLENPETNEHVTLPKYYTTRLEPYYNDEEFMAEIRSGEYGARVYQTEKGYARFEFVPLND